MCDPSQLGCYTLQDDGVTEIANDRVNDAGSVRIAGAISARRTVLVFLINNLLMTCKIKLKIKNIIFARFHMHVIVHICNCYNCTPPNFHGHHRTRPLWALRCQAPCSTVTSNTTCVG